MKSLKIIATLLASFLFVASVFADEEKKTEAPKKPSLTYYYLDG